MFNFPRSEIDDRAYFIMFYVPWCRGCKRMAEQWDALADAFSRDRRVVLARFDCMQDEDFCSERQGIEHTPTLKLYHRGKAAETYRADIYHVDLMRPFLASRLDRLQRGDAAAAAPQQPQQPTAGGAAADTLVPAPAPAPAAPPPPPLRIQMPRQDPPQEQLESAPEQRRGVHRPVNASSAGRTGGSFVVTEPGGSNTHAPPAGGSSGASIISHNNSSSAAPHGAQPGVSRHDEKARSSATAAVEGMGTPSAAEELRVDPMVVDVAGQMVTDARVQPAHAGDAADGEDGEEVHVRQGRNGGPAVDMLHRDREEL
ncbi:hypothetical protein HXX76_003356 [Chlamydomonas incerta]|uniref:Thioredoxin domain-containing protein n=1 Tax=Chlamydomonas incerta TaxID=51695 RepID=A0A835TMW4_CHLIN|nr:hypothetical protein HXX76_003356 [Chlamydomonas incerta]|eukprot:KAG2441741.1 hypothetical protein HXX76_003356 [Chlamydomonas incerta]